jgi:hypothetical protein
VSAAMLEMAGGIGRVAMDLPVTLEDHKQHHPTLCARQGVYLSVFFLFCLLLCY